MKIIETSVFETAEEYERARIPGVVCTDSGTVIAYCELRRSDSDWAVIDIGMRKSTDNGKTWSQRKILVSGDNKNTVNNPVMIADGDVLHFICCLNYKKVLYMKSTDEGESWTNVKELTESIKLQTGDFFWSCIATGPTHGIKLSSGRLLVPVWLAFNKEDEKSHHPSVITTLYSDDKGESWKVGKIFDGLTDPSEFCVAEVNGHIIANIRHENREKCRAVGEISPDTEIFGVKFSENLPDPVCCAGMCALGDELLFSNCANSAHRKNLTLRKLSDDMRIKESLMISESAGYSDVYSSPDQKTACVIYEKEKCLFCAVVSIY